MNPSPWARRLFFESRQQRAMRIAGRLTWWLLVLVCAFLFWWSAR